MISHSLKKLEAYLFHLRNLYESLRDKYLQTERAVGPARVCFILIGGAREAKVPRRSK